MVTKADCEAAEQEAQRRRGNTGMTKVVKFTELTDSPDDIDSDIIEWLESRPDVNLIKSGHVYAPAVLSTGEVAAAREGQFGTEGIVGWEVILD